ncbi:hypothetical protein J3Q64DRAFT_1832992 [Phycomyces blakesleeanus]|uniref:Uncharacterized protein n=1 Tax=Phycomyces blakesleeanus TaxID=4837 RepID=A0ABR3B1N7_PHYBL
MSVRENLANLAQLKVQKDLFELTSESSGIHQKKKKGGLTIAFQGPQERIRQGSKTHSARHDYIMNTVPHSIHSPWLKHKTQATKTQNPANQTRQANRTTVAQKRPRIKDSGSPTRTETTTHRSRPRTCEEVNKNPTNKRFQPTLQQCKHHPRMYTNGKYQRQTGLKTSLVPPQVTLICRPPQSTFSLYCLCQAKTQNQANRRSMVSIPEGNDNPVL